MGIVEPEGKQNSLFPAELAIKCFVTPLNSKIESKTEKNRLIDVDWQTNLPQFT